MLSERKQAVPVWVFPFIWNTQKTQWWQQSTGTWLLLGQLLKRCWWLHTLSTETIPVEVGSGWVRCPHPPLWDMQQPRSILHGLGLFLEPLGRVVAPGASTLNGANGACCPC